MADIRRTPTLDDFSYVADPIESNTLGKPWEKFGTGSVRANGDLFHPDGAGDSFYIWRDIVSRGAIEVWGLGHGAPDVSEGWRIGFVRSNAGAGDARGFGYEVLIDGGADPVGWQLRRYDGDSPTIIGGYSGFGVGGNYALIRREGANLEGWWSNDGVSWTQIFSNGDTTYIDGLSPGLGMSSDDGTQESWTEFGGGVVYRTQIYRYVSQ